MNTPESFLVDIVGANPALGIVLEEWGLDYCKSAEETLARACHAEGLDLAEVEAALKRAGEVGSKLAGRSRAELVAYVRHSHHDYLRRFLPQLLESMKKVLRLYGAERRELVQVSRVLQVLAQDVLDHISKEEMFAFPWIVEGETPHPWILESLAEDRRRASFRLNCLRFLTNHYKLPAGERPSQSELYAGLRELEKNLRRHVYVEDRLLFARHN